MKRLSRLTALLLAIMLSLSMIPAALAEEVMTKNQLDDLVLQTIENFPNLPVEEQYSVIMSLKDDREAAEMLLGTLSEEQYQAFINYAFSLREPYEFKTVTVTNAGPFMPAVNVAQMRMMRMRALAANEVTSGANVEGLVTQKSVVGDATNGYKLILESYVEGSSKISVETTTTPADIVLVLDQSGSMADDFNGSSRQYAMKQAVNNFIDSVAGKYKETADHRMAIVTFGSDASTIQGWTDVDAKGRTTLTGKINGLPDSPSGATKVDEGMTQAETLMGKGYSYTGKNTTRQKVVIVFTDGVPTTSRDFDTTVATNAIASAKNLKDADVTVYTVGIFNGADPSQLYGSTGFDRNSNGTVGSNWSDFSFWMIGDIKSYDVPAGNRFLNYLSSNYADATEIGIENYKATFLGVGYYGWKITKNFNRTAESEKNYYLTAKDSESLNTIFQTISNQIQTGGASITLDEETIVKDILSEQFTLPTDTNGTVIKSGITAHTETYTGETNGVKNWTKNDDSASFTPAVSTDGRTITVSGFNYSDNWVGTTTNADNSTTVHGKKLVLEIPIEVRDGFWGGNNVPTNGADSGIYSDGAVVENYDVPAVNVPLNVPALETENKNIYLLNTPPTVPALYNSADFVKQTGENAWQTAFVNISTTGADGTISNTDDTTVNIEVTVEASEVANADSVGTAVTAPVTQEGEANVYVFKPTMKFQDTTVKYLDPVPEYEKNNRVPYSVGQDGLDPLMVKWEHPTSTGTPEGTAPTLDLTYEPISGVDDDGKITSETYVPVKVTVKIGTEDVTSYTTFEHADCACTEQIEGRKCQWQKDPVEKYGHFLLHVINVVADLTITKSDLNKYAYQDGTDNESAIFTVTATDKTGKVQTWIIALANGESVTIKDLKVNSQYTIAEQNAWTWRYKDMAKVKGTITRDENGNGVTVTIKNEADNPYWLGGDNYATNVFGNSN